MIKLEFPPLDGPVDPAWCAPLLTAIESIDSVHRCYRLSPGDFTCKYRVVRPERPDVYAFKHLWTHQYLNLDSLVHPYRYVATRHPAQGPGRFLRYRNLAAALDHLVLDEVPGAPHDTAARHELIDAEHLDARHDNQQFSDGEEGNHGDLHLV